MILFQVTRLALALRAVVDATGQVGAAALEDYCAARERQDKAQDEGSEEKV